MPRILMLAPACYPLTGPEQIVNTKLVLAGIRAGWEIDVFSMMHGGYSYPWETSDIWQSVAERIVYAPQTLSERSPSRFAMEIWGALQTGCPTRGAAWAAWAVRKGTQMARSRHYDFILSRSFPAFIAGPILSHRTGIPLIMNWNDPWPPSAYPLPYGKGRNAAFSRSERSILGRAARRAVWHTFPSERLRRYMCPYLSEDVLGRSSVIPHVALSELCRKPTPHDEDCFLICHAGYAGEDRQLGALCAGIRQFMNNHTEKILLMIRTFGSSIGNLTKLAHTEGIGDCISSVNPMPYEKSLDVLAGSDCLMIMEGLWEEGVFLPSKMADYAQIGLPILALTPKSSEVGDILRAHGGGIAADNASPHDVAKAIQRLYLSWKKKTLQNEYGSSHLYSIFGEDTVMKQYAELFHKLAEREHRTDDFCDRPAQQAPGNFK